MKNQLTSGELANLITSVFSLTPADKKLALLVDVPDDKVPDNPHWQERRKMAADWQRQLQDVKTELNIDEVNLVIYPNVHSNNADLPPTVYLYEPSIEHLDAATLQKQGPPVDLKKFLSATQLVIALTELSATAPLKLLAPGCGFRAVTMPGFHKDMIPALRLDYEQINNRIMTLKNILDPAPGLVIEFHLDDDMIYHCFFDLRFRTAHASGGRFPQPGTAGNLPGGECYIVPYEGEKNVASLSMGILPVQFEDEIVLYQIENNKAQAVRSRGRYSKQEAQKIKEEPAYANIAEIGFGILRDFGIKPIGQILLDEKLGLHIAFGRSDHFGGAVGIKDFSSPEKVVHIDRIYIPETQNKIRINHVSVIKENGEELNIMKDGTYTIF